MEKTAEGSLELPGEKFTFIEEKLSLLCVRMVSCLLPLHGPWKDGSRSKGHVGSP